MKYNPRDENSIKAVMAKANVVINLIGRFFYFYLIKLTVKVFSILDGCE